MSLSLFHLCSWRIFASGDEWTILFFSSLDFKAVSPLPSGLDCISIWTAASWCSPVHVSALLWCFQDYLSISGVQPFNCSECGGDSYPSWGLLSFWSLRWCFTTIWQVWTLISSNSFLPFSHSSPWTLVLLTSYHRWVRFCWSPFGLLPPWSLKSRLHLPSTIGYWMDPVKFPYYTF